MNILGTYSDEELISLFVECGYNMAKLDRKFGLTKNTTLREFKKRGIRSFELLEKHKLDIISKYNENPKLCKHCGKPIPWEKRDNTFCSSSCAASENNVGIIRNPLGIGRLRTSSLYSTEEKLTAYHHNKLIDEKYSDLKIKHLLPGQCPICGEYNCSKKFCKENKFIHIIGYVKHLGFDPSTIGTQDVTKEFYRIRDLVYNLYWIQKKSLLDLQRIFNYSSLGSLYLVIKRLNIELRDNYEAGILACSEGRLNISENSIYGNPTWHTTWTGDEIFLRSSYELEYAEYLDSNQISYSVESLRIEYYDTQQNKTRIAIPDFYLPGTNEIVEIKSDFTLDIQEMRDKFGQYNKVGYSCKLILEKEEVDLYNIENEVSEERLDKILNKNINKVQNNNKKGPVV